MRVGGIILCGGRSSRMGRPKAWLPFGNEALLQRVVRVVRSVVDPVMVVSAPQQDLPALPPEVLIIPDAAEYRGPLQGLANGLTALSDRADVVFLSSCDTPFLQPRFIRRMIDLLGEDDIVVPEFEEHRHPLTGVYRIGVLGVADVLLKAGRFRLLDLIDSCRTRIVTFNDWHDVDPESRSLRNLNTPEDYEAALRDETSISSSA